MLLRFALQLLGELADMCGPFQSTLLKLREALLPSIYSCCSGPSLSGSRPLQFDMLPWFALAGRLRRQNNQLLEQQAAFSLELTKHQVWILFPMLWAGLPGIRGCVVDSKGWLVWCAGRGCQGDWAGACQHTHGLHINPSCPGVCSVFVGSVWHGP